MHSDEQDLNFDDYSFPQYVLTAEEEAAIEREAAWERKLEEAIERRAAEIRRDGFAVHALDALAYGDSINELDKMSGDADGIFGRDYECERDGCQNVLLVERKWLKYCSDSCFKIGYPLELAREEFERSDDDDYYDEDPRNWL